MKKLWFDTETTGLDPVENDIIQIAGIIEVDGKKEVEFDFRCKPIDPGNVTIGAMETHGYTLEEMNKWDEPMEIYSRIKRLFDSHINKYVKPDKFMAFGYNAKFDIDMLNHFFRKLGDKYMYSYIHPFPVDVGVLASICIAEGKIARPASMQLSVLCESLDIEIDAHDAVEDVLATRTLYNKLINTIRG